MIIFAVIYPNKVLESKIKDDLRLDQECSPETEVKSFMLKVEVSDQACNI